MGPGRPWLRWVIGFTLLLFAACSSEVKTDEAGELEQGDKYDLPSRRTRLTPEELPEMPGYPDSVPGNIVAVSAGDFPVNGSWPAGAGVCDSVAMIELYTDDLRNGTAIVMHFGDTEVEGEYAVLPADTALSVERVARLGVQVFDETEAFGLKAISGVLQVSDVDGHISGRFQATLMETQTEVLTRYVGVFLRIPLSALPETYCATLGDSLRVQLVEADTGEVSPAEEPVRP